MSELIAAWITALRSGRYKQGKGSLRRTDGSYCCLGVLCDVKDALGWTKPDYGNYYFWGGVSGTLPEHLSHEVGMTYREANILSDMNDNKGKTFTQIADYLEGNKL